MSRSNPTPTNPAKRFFTWSGSTGKLVYYDKEQGSEVEVKMPFEFLVLDQLATISGFCEPDESHYWSNEVRSIAKEELTIKTSKGTKYIGLYKNSQGMVQVPQGARYAKSIYISFKDGENGFVIGNLRASGAALTAWIDFSNKNTVALGKCRLTGSEEAKKGATKYYVPTFEWSNADTSEDEIAKELDTELQVYLSQYLATTHFDRNSQEELPSQIDDAGFTPNMKKALDGGEPISLDDIPY